MHLQRVVLLISIVATLFPAQAWASGAPLCYVDGTLDVPKWTGGFLDHSDERGFLIRWANGTDKTLVPYHRILLAEFGAYAPQPVSKQFTLRNMEPRKFLTLIYLDDWQHTQIVELELKRHSDVFTDLLRQRTEYVISNSPVDATILAGSYGSSLPVTSRRVKFWSSTLPGSGGRGTPAQIEIGPAGGITVTLASGKYKIDPGSVTSLEFGENVKSGAARALIVSAVTMNELALMLMTKKVNHLLSLTFQMDGIPQAVVLELPKYCSRVAIIELEMLVGKRVDYEKSKTELYG